MARFLSMVAGIAILVASNQISACTLCNMGAVAPMTFGQEWQKAKIIVFGSAANPRYNGPGSPPGTGTTDLVVHQVFKNDPFLGDKRLIQLERYIPVVDPKQPPQFLVFCDVYKEKLNAYLGKSVPPEKTKVFLGYLESVKGLQEKERTQALLHYFRFLDHPDEIIAQDAFFEFARSSDKEVGQVAKQLQPEKLRALLENPKTRPERLGLFAFMLGACGTHADADYLRGLIEKPTDRTYEGLDGILSGYISLRPQQGWQLTASLLADPNTKFPQRLAAFRTVRFYHGWKGDEYTKQILHCLKIMINDADVADLAIEELRKWKMWDLTKEIARQFTQPAYDTPIIRQAILRYMIGCPLDEARAFLDVQRQRPQLREIIEELEEGLKRTGGK